MIALKMGFSRWGLVNSYGTAYSSQEEIVGKRPRDGFFSMQPPSGNRPLSLTECSERSVPDLIEAFSLSQIYLLRISQRE